MEITYVALQCRLTWIFTVSTSSKSAMGSLSPFSSSTLLTGLNRQTTFMLDDMSAGAAPSQIRDNAAKQRLDHRSQETTLGNTDGVLFAAATRLLKGVVSGLWTCPSVWWSAVFCVAPLVARTRISLQRRLVARSSVRASLGAVWRLQRRLRSTGQRHPPPPPPPSVRRGACGAQGRARMTLDELEEEHVGADMSVLSYSRNLVTLIFSKSAVYVHPTPRAKDNIPGFLR